MNLSFEVLEGKEHIEKYLKFIASLRLLVFKEFPYLYAGSVKHEMEYLAAYSEIKNATLVLAKDQELVVGFLTGVPIASESKIIADLKQKLIESGRNNLEHLYYYGEAIILPAYKEASTISYLSKNMDKKVKNLGYNESGILTVIRDSNHALRPKDYGDIDSLFLRAKFKKTDIVVNYSWPTFISVNEAVETMNPMRFWVKPL